MIDIPVTEPAALRAGDTWKWNRQDLTDYPATLWDLKYAFKSAAAHVEITAAADGANFAVVVSSTVTATYAAGEYSWVAFVELIGSSPVERYQVDQGRFTILPTFANAAALDDRTHARKVLDAIKAVLEGRASKDQEEYTISDRSLKRTPIPDLLKLRQLYEREVASEAAAERLANGQSPRNRLMVRF